MKSKTILAGDGKTLKRQPENGELAQKPVGERSQVPLEAPLNNATFTTNFVAVYPPSRGLESVIRFEHWLEQSG